MSPMNVENQSFQRWIKRESSQFEESP